MYKSIPQSESEKALCEVLNWWHEQRCALPAKPSLKFFISKEERAAIYEERAKIDAMARDIEEEAMRRIEDLAKAGDMVAESFLRHWRLSEEQKAEMAAAWRGQYDGDY